MPDQIFMKTPRLRKLEIVQPVNFSTLWHCCVRILCNSPTGVTHAPFDHIVSTYVLSFPLQNGPLRFYTTLKRLKGGWSIKHFHPKEVTFPFEQLRRHFHSHA